MPRHRHPDRWRRRPLPNRPLQPPIKSRRPRRRRPKRRWTSSTCCASFATKKRRPRPNLGLSQADDRLCAGDRREAVERCAVRGGRQRRLLSRRSLDDPHLVDRHEPDLLDQEADLAHQPVHDVRARESLAPRGGPSLPVDLARDVRARHERGHPHGRAGQLRLLQALPDLRTIDCVRVCTPARGCISTTTPT